MSSNSHPKPETELTRLLRRGDPAAEHEELSPVQATRMRRALLAELETAERRPPFAWRPVLATATAAALALALVLAGWQGKVKPAPQRNAERPAHSAEAPRPASAAAPQAQVVAAAEPASVAPGTQPPRARSRRGAVKPPPAETLRSARQIDFQTPGGTRVVWVLDPHFSLDHSEVQSR